HRDGDIKIEPIGGARRFGGLAGEIEADPRAFGGFAKFGSIVFGHVDVFQGLQEGQIVDGQAQGVAAVEATGIKEVLGNRREDRLYGVTISYPAEHVTAIASALQSVTITPRPIEVG